MAVEDTQKPNNAAVARLPLGSRLARLDPLIWFVCIGAALFGLDAVRPEPPRTVIEVTPDMAEIILSNQAALAGAELPPEVAARTLDRFVEEEILVREAVRRGLHLGDPKVRARLIAKMEFLLATEAPAPTPEDLAALQAADPERYRTLRRYSFDQRFFGDDQDAAVAAMESFEATGEMPATGSHKFWLGDTLEAYSRLQLSSVMGASFLRALPDLPEGEWFGPVRSGRGWHLIRLTGVQEPGPLPDWELQARLLEDWKKSQWITTRQSALRGFAQSYDIRLPDIEQPLRQTALAEPTD